MNASVNLITHPEIEYRPLVFSPQRVDGKGPHRTLVDVLEIFSESVVWREHLDQTGLLNHFKDKERTHLNGLDVDCRLRVIFIDDLDINAGLIEQTSNIQPECISIASWFQYKFGISPIFLQCVNFPRNWVTIGSAFFIKGADKGRSSILDGLYRYPPDLMIPNATHDRCPPVHVWFSHSLSPNGASTYLIHKCPPTTKQLLLSCANGPKVKFLLRPLAVDVFLAEDCVQRWAEWVSETRFNLLKYEQPLPEDLHHSVTAQAVEDLYQLSQHFQVVRDLMADVQDKLDFLVSLMKQRDRILSFQNLEEDASTMESLLFVKSKNEALTRWIINYAERTQVQINRFFSHAAHKDNAVNVSISELTSKIAVSTQKDSSAMITMAAVTMVFLPASFVAALFSTVFFDIDTDATGRVTLIVHHQWWIFLVVSIPLTILVFLTWNVWWRIRDRMTMKQIPPGSVLQRRLEQIDVHLLREKSGKEYSVGVKSSPRSPGWPPFGHHSE